MRILQAAKFYPPPFGGIETVVDQLARGLPNIADNIEVQILATRQRGQQVTRKLPERVFLKEICAWTTLARTPIAPSYPLELRRLKADVIHFHFPYPWAEISHLIYGRGTPYIITYHSDIIKQKRIKTLYAPFMKAFLDRAKHIVVGSPHILDSSETLKPYKNKTSIIPLGINTSRFAKAYCSPETVARIRGQFSTNRPLLFFLGRLVYYKGIDVLLDAMSSIDANLILAGSGPMLDHIQTRIAKLKLEDRVQLVPRIEDDELPSYYRASDVFVLPSTDESEAFGLVMLEAHSSGVPTVSSDLPTGVTFVNQHGRTGLCARTGSAESLSRSINTLLSSPTLRTEFSLYAQKRAVADFDSAQMCKSYFELYQSIISSSAMKVNPSDCF